MEPLGVKSASFIRERCIEKKSKKKLTSFSFAFTHTYTLEKLTLLLFFPKRTWKILKNVQNAKEKTFHFITLSHVICGSFSPSFLNLSLYVILDIPEVPAFKKRAQAKDGHFFGQKHLLVFLLFLCTFPLPCFFFSKNSRNLRTFFFANLNSTR